MISVIVKPKVEVASLWAPVEWMHKEGSLCLSCVAVCEQSQGSKGAQGPVAGQEMRISHMG